MKQRYRTEAAVQSEVLENQLREWFDAFLIVGFNKEYGLTRTYVADSFADLHSLHSQLQIALRRIEDQIDNIDLGIDPDDLYSDDEEES